MNFPKNNYLEKIQSILMIKKCLFLFGIIASAILLSCHNDSKKNKREALGKVSSSTVLEETNDTPVSDTTMVINKLIKDHFPNYQLLEFYKGQVNDDQEIDLVLILEKPCTLDSANLCRKTIFLINKHFPNFEMATTNDSIVEPVDRDYPFQGFQSLTIHEGQVNFHIRYGSCLKEDINVVFTYDKKLEDWLLDSLMIYNHHCEEGEYGSSLYTKEHLGEVRFKDSRPYYNYINHSNEEADQVDSLKLKLTSIDQSEFLKYNAAYPNPFQDDIVEEAKLGTSFKLLVAGEEKEFACQNYKDGCYSSAGFLPPLNLYFLWQGFDLYGATYALDRDTGEEMMLNTPFDVGPDKFFLSKNETQLLALSNSPFDYESHLSLFKKDTTYSIGLSSPHEYFSPFWKVDQLAWVDENSFVLKIYDKEEWSKSSKKHLKTGVAYYLATILK